MTTRTRHLTPVAEPSHEDRDYGIEAQYSAEIHLDLCDAALYAQEAGVEDEDELLGQAPASPAVGPYCGCQTCVVREVLAIAWPIFHAAALAGVPVD